MMRNKDCFGLGTALVIFASCFVSAGGAPLTNMVIQSGGGKRFTAPDEGKPISYVVDADAYPTNFTLPQVLTALSNAFTAWSDTTYIRFQFDGVQSFGQPAKTAALLNQDHRIWVQLHNLHTNITVASQLGTGDNRASISERLPGSEWTGGGSIAGNDFFDILAAWVAINPANAAFNSLTTLEEVFCHNIGLALGLETNTNDPTSIMYHQTHADGRGAQLGSLDVNVIQQAYPSNNPAPFTFDREMEIVTTPTNQPALNVAGINQLLLRGYDLQSENLTLEITNVTSTLGTFTNQNGLLSYRPKVFNESTNVTSERFYFRFSDGTHQSPYGEVVVRSFRKDSFPAATGDGIPDYFMTNYFGNPDPSVGPNRGANDDLDGDSLSNLEEYIAGMNPTQAESAQRVSLLPGGRVEWQSKPSALYELQSSTNLMNWAIEKPLFATKTTASVTVGTRTNSRTFYRAVKVQ